MVHFTRKKDSDPSNLNLDPLPSSCPIFPDCGFQRPDSGVILTCIDCFLNNGSLYQFEYGVHPSVFLAKLRGGTCTTAQADPPETVVLIYIIGYKIFLIGRIVIHKVIGFHFRNLILLW